MRPPPGVCDGDSQAYSSTLRDTHTHTHTHSSLLFLLSIINNTNIVVAIVIMRQTRTTTTPPPPPPLIADILGDLPPTRPGKSSDGWWLFFLTNVLCESVRGRHVVQGQTGLTSFICRSHFYLTPSLIASVATWRPLLCFCLILPILVSDVVLSVPSWEYISWSSPLVYVVARSKFLAWRPFSKSAFCESG